MSDELSPSMSSFLVSSISSSDICASRCLFSWSIEGSFDLSVTSICCRLAADPFPLLLPSCARYGDAMVGPACLFGWLTSLAWFSLLCLNFEGAVLILCAGKPASEPLFLGGAGGLAFDEAVRSLISPTRPKLKPGTCAGAEELTPSDSSSDSKVIWKR